MFVQKLTHVKKKKCFQSTQVPAGNLSVSVGIFCFCAAVALTTLSYRRSMYGAELGGPAGPAKATFGFFVSLWLFYVAMSAANEYGAFK